MTNQEFDKLLLDNKDNLKEILAFWNWIRGFNSFLKWMVLIGGPIGVGLWQARNWIKSH